jgi:hypothetical protein
VTLNRTVEPGSNLRISLMVEGIVTCPFDVIFGLAKEGSGSARPFRHQPHFPGFHPGCLQASLQRPALTQNYLRQDISTELG